MATVVTTLKSAEIHSLGVLADAAHIAPLEAAALARLRQWYPHHGVSAVDAQVIPGGAAVKFTITSTIQLQATDVKPALK